MFRYLIAPFVIAVLLGVGAVALFATIAMEAPDSPSQPQAVAPDAPPVIKTAPETEPVGEIATASIEAAARATDSAASPLAPALGQNVSSPQAGAAPGQTVGGASAPQAAPADSPARAPQAFSGAAPSAPSGLTPSLPSAQAPAASTALAAASVSPSAAVSGAAPAGQTPPGAAAPGLSTPPRIGVGGATPPLAPGASALNPTASAETALALAGNLAPALEAPLGGGANPEQLDEAPDLRPVFDLVRVEPGGAAVLAGRASPNAMVSVTVDGDVVAEVRANRSGEFVALVETAPDPQTRGVTLGLSSTTVDGMTLVSAAPVVVALPDAPGAPPVALRPTADGPELLQPTAPRADGGVSIDSVSYGDEGAVVVSGRGAPGQTARVYLDENLHAEAEVKPDGAWRADLSQEIKPEIYKLRVDQIDDRGGVSSRAETPFERAPVEDIVLNRSGVVVQPGNNLWRIASHVYGDGLKYHVIYARNSDQIRDPNLIYPGQIFSLPGAE